MLKLSAVPRRTIKHMTSPSEQKLRSIHKWMIVWGMMSMLDYSPIQQNDWMILNRFQRRYC